MKSKDQILLEKVYQKVSENYKFINSGPEPPINPPEYYQREIECPECGGPMYDARPGGHRSDKWEWEFKCKDENCEGIISGDNLP